MQKLSQTRIFILIIALTGSPAWGQDINALKAAYVYYFSKLISWENSSAAPGDTINICFHSNNTAIAQQFQSLAGKVAGEQTVAVNQLNDAKNDHNECHVIFQDTAVFDAKQAPQLIVSDQADLPADIRFVINNNKLGFEININHLQKKNLKASSRLLRLAVKVKQ
jgi:hypothetical protein